MLLKLAWRNIWRNRHRSLITMSAIGSAVLLAIVTVSLQQGVFDNLVKNLVSLYTGYVQVHGKGYWEEQTLENSFSINDTVCQTVLQTPECAISPFAWRVLRSPLQGIKHAVVW
jgi:putative ABC transport system permease protein